MQFNFAKYYNMGRWDKLSNRSSTISPNLASFPVLQWKSWPKSSIPPIFPYMKNLVPITHLLSCGWKYQSNSSELDNEIKRAIAYNYMEMKKQNRAYKTMMVRSLYQVSDPVQKTINSNEYRAAYGDKVKPWSCLISEAAT